jgi:hypothetical protein
MRKKGFRYLSVCRDCRAVESVAGKDFHRAAPPRCVRCGGLLDKALRAVNKKRKPPQTALGAPRLERFKDAQCLLEPIKRSAQRHGIKVQWANHGQHVWFNKGGKRLVDYWPKTGTARAHCVLRQLSGIAYALDWARQISNSDMTVL